MSVKTAVLTSHAWIPWYRVNLRTGCILDSASVKRTYALWVADLTGGASESSALFRASKESPNKCLLV